MVVQFPIFVLVCKHRNSEDEEIPTIAFYVAFAVLSAVLVVLISSSVEFLNWTSSIDHCPNRYRPDAVEVKPVHLTNWFLCSGKRWQNVSGCQLAGTLSPASGIKLRLPGSGVPPKQLSVFCPDDNCRESNYEEFVVDLYRRIILPQSCDDVFRVGGEKPIALFPQAVDVLRPAGNRIGVERPFEVLEPPGNVLGLKVAPTLSVMPNRLSICVGKLSSY
jgi:hypothetical protein